MPQKCILFILLVSIELIKADGTPNDCYWTGCQPITWQVQGCQRFGGQEFAREACLALVGLRGTVAGFKYECCTSTGGTGWNEPYNPTWDGYGVFTRPFYPFDVPPTYYENPAPLQGGFTNFVGYGPYKRNTN